MSSVFESVPQPPSVGAATAPAVPRRGGVGAALATADWWEHFYTSRQDTYWDWYLPNEIVLQVLQREARLQIRVQEPLASATDSETCAQHEEDREEHQRLQQLHAPQSPAHGQRWVAADSPEAAARLAALSTLQLGCGNSEVSALMWEAGWRSAHNVDFSPACIERMQQLQKEHHWITDAATAQAAGAAAAAAAACASAAASSADAIAACVSSGFVFSVADVRDLSRYPSDTFGLIFDKGTLDCVCLESEGDPRAAAVQTLREVWRCLRPGGASVCFSLYPPAARALLWAEALPEEQGGESAADLQQLAEALAADNPPTVMRTLAPWSELRMQALQRPPLEMPNQKHTYLYIAYKR